jgi:hypothetical protein
MRVVGWVGAILSLIALTLALTRGAFLAVAVVTIWLVAAWRPIRRPGLLLLGVLAVFLILRINPLSSLVNANLVLQRIASINTQTYTAQLRFELWHVAIRMFEHTFPFGIGAKNFPAQAPLYGVAIPGGSPSNAHDTPLVVLSELGLAGMVAFGWLAIAIIRSLFTSLKSVIEPQRSLAIALSASFLALAVDGITDYSYGEDSFLLSVVLLLALIARLSRETAPE